MSEQRSWRYTLPPDRPRDGAIDDQGGQRRVGEVDEFAATAELADLTRLPSSNRAIVLAPGEQPLAVSRYRRRGGRRVVLTANELIMINGWRRFRFALPASAVNSHRRHVVRHLASVYVHRRVIGPLSKGLKYVYALDGQDRLLGTIDLSNTWPYPDGGVGRMCELAGVVHTVEAFETPRELVAAHPDWAAPELEFEVNHPGQEAVREWTQGIYVFVALAVPLGGVGIAAFLVSPIGRWFRACVLAATVISIALSAWAASRLRMRNSLRSQQRRQTRRNSGPSSPPPGTADPTSAQPEI